MFTLDLNGLSPADFLAQYWQKQPLVIRGGFKNFNDPISADELAGLACEEEVESRLVYQKGDEWHAEHGPFDDYQHLGDRNWSLLLQGVDHWDSDVAALISPFRFLPNWRIDDVMVSFATPGGGVGPHVDNYDVFIVQGSGKRRWQVGSKDNYTEVVAHSALLHVEPFEAIIDVEMNPGDILYIPPGFPHQGTTLENSMSFSVGFRTMAKQQLLSAYADHLLDNELATQMVEDADRPACNQPGLIDGADVKRLRDGLLSTLADPAQLQQFLGLQLSQAKHELDLQPDEAGFDPQEIVQLLNDGHRLQRLGGLRCLYFEQSDKNSDTCQIYVNGECFTLDSHLFGALQLFCDHEQLTGAELAPWLAEPAVVSFVGKMLKLGYWYFDAESA